ncbi:MAG: hypothetical protein JKY20_10245 [Alphaproteobacteria bacterium]|nr:hypothetical protein [Alphaproteobacteria bacterium]
MSQSDKSGDTPTRWLDRPDSAKKICWALYVLCAALFFADAFYEKHSHYAVEDWFGFYAIFGFVFSIGLVLSAKELRRLVMRKEDYYD